MMEGMMGIAVFTDDRALLDYAEKMWHEARANVLL